VHLKFIPQSKNKQTNKTKKQQQLEW